MLSYIGTVWMKCFESRWDFFNYPSSSAAKDVIDSARWLCHWALHAVLKGPGLTPSDSNPKQGLASWGNSWMIFSLQTQKFSHPPVALTKIWSLSSSPADYTPKRCTRKRTFPMTQLILPARCGLRYGAVLQTLPSSRWWTGLLPGGPRGELCRCEWGRSCLPTTLYICPLESKTVHPPAIENKCTCAWTNPW